MKAKHTTTAGQATLARADREDNWEKTEILTLELR